ncbi:hypothetical protein Kpol_1042p7 [Vanderwaltozyma polyspora DSM 70294]|uniref:Zn(2)-C6 fungal-type domain-containing protein n=1 Tax=Vanderwaltozyma polyspora (strain ATCC 22028 / DSM 70294 / BCRC 21397 / CBS 2163 / NBRC 10782 / NRRL Y-8283 / UCD 57-17) TaxID=436907 RepID=A7TQ95_VANPO|nr:uncharacterized protein Kpol_1042p7 [Vanderwaltozyma polyspora DSM 70294]EDO15549.1 hypothetical protein Kpol_1042p7 [Vanderwaltozyma polyspora DSM 70294]
MPIVMNRDTGNKVEKKKRKKKIKSCLFCRKRKLRCGQEKPMCSTCQTRGFATCEYLVADSPDSSKAGTSPGSNKSPSSVQSSNTKYNGIQDSIISDNSPASIQTNSLEEGDLKQVKKDSSVVRNRVKLSTYRNNAKANGEAIEEQNPLSTLSYVQIKKDARCLKCGPTSVKTFIYKANWNNMQGYYEKLWSKVQEARRKWKKIHDFTMLKELKLVERPLEYDTVYLLEAVCHDLPPYDVIIECIDRFFQMSDIYPYNNVLDKNKIMSDFYREFSPGIQTSKDEIRRVQSLSLNRVFNVYKIGVIVMILCLTHYYESVPMSIDIFITYLSGLSTSKVFFVERVQFFLFRFFYVPMYRSCGGDYSHCVNLSSALCTSALCIGLNDDIDVTFKGRENEVGRLDTLKALWLWVMYADFVVASHLGKDLMVPLNSFDDIDFLDLYESEGNSKTLLGCLIRFLRLTRPMMHEVMSRRGKPDLIEYTSQLINFIETEFPPLEYYTDAQMIDKVPLDTLSFISLCIFLIVTFSGLRCLALGEQSLNLKNQTIKTCLTAFSLGTNIANRAYQLDKEKFPEVVYTDCNNFPPHLAYCIGSCGTSLGRSLSLFFTLCYQKMTLFSSGFIFCQQDMESEIDLTTLQGPDDKSLSFIASFDAFSRIFQTWAKPVDENFKSVLYRSNTLIIMTTLERLCSMILVKVKECRTKTENDWITHNQNNILDVLMNENDEPNPRIPEPTNENLIESFTQYGKLEDFANSLSDEFWENYFSHWEEYLNGNTIDELFEDISHVP